MSEPAIFAFVQDDFRACSPDGSWHTGQRWVVAGGPTLYVRTEASPLEVSCDPGNSGVVVKLSQVYGVRATVEAPGAEEVEG